MRPRGLVRAAILAGCLAALTAPGRVETVTVADVYALVGRPMPDPLPIAGPEAMPIPALPILIGAGSIALILAGAFVLFRVSR